MKPIKYPVEVCTWKIFDENGNGQVEIRDADRNFVFYMRIKGREIGEMNHLKGDLAPLVARLINTHRVQQIADETRNEPLDALISHKKADFSEEKPKVSQSERMKAYWAQRRAK